MKIILKCKRLFILVIDLNVLLKRSAFLTIKLRNLNKLVDSYMVIYNIFNDNY